jgi:hypothetical protein
MLPKAAAVPLPARQNSAIDRLGLNVSKTLI